MEDKDQWPEIRVVLVSLSKAAVKQPVAEGQCEFDQLNGDVWDFT